MRVRVWAAGLVILLAASLPAGAALPAGTTVLRHIKEARKNVKDYTVDLDIHMDVPNVKMPDTTLRIFYKAPDKVKLQPVKGFAILPKGTIFTGDPFASLGQHFTAEVKDQMTLNGRPVYSVRLVPLDGPPDRYADAWVDRERWLVLKLRSVSPMGQAITMDIQYQLQQGAYWLPTRSVAHLELPADMPEHHSRFGPPPKRAKNGKNGQKPAPAAGLRQGTVTFTFRNYKVNTGLPDSLFKKQKEEE